MRAIAPVLVAVLAGLTVLPAVSAGPQALLPAAGFNVSSYAVGKADLHVRQVNPQQAMALDCAGPTPVEFEFLHEPSWWGDGAAGLTLPLMATCTHDAATGVGFDSCLVGDQGATLSCTMSWDACPPPQNCWGELQASADGFFSGQGYAYTELYDAEGQYAGTTGYAFSFAGRVARVADPIESLPLAAASVAPAGGSLETARELAALLG